MWKQAKEAVMYKKDHLVLRVIIYCDSVIQLFWRLRWNTMFLDNNYVF